MPREVRFPVPVFQRSQVPLFASSDGLPFTHTQLDQAIQSVMEVTMTIEQRSDSFHSFRIYLCACLYRANASTERIQRMMRWNLSSGVYRSVFSRRFAGHCPVALQWLDIAATQDIATIQVANLPVDSIGTLTKVLSFRMN